MNAADWAYALKDVPWSIWLVVGVVVLFGIGSAAAMWASRGPECDVDGTPVGGPVHPKYLTLEELNCEVSYGVQRVWIGEVGDAVAVTGERRRGLAAIHEMARRDLGSPAGCYRVETGWARFSVGGPDGDDGWVMDLCQPGDDGALAVVLAREVGEVTHV